jgi:ribose-phosphate pyrophosphokinase
MIEVAGADRYITLDLHAGQIQGFFSIPGDVLSAFHITVDYLRSIASSFYEPVVVTADLGFAKKGRNYAAGLNVPMAFIEKRRISNEAKSEALTLIGDVKGRDVLLVDDEVDTGGSMVQAVTLLNDKGARNIYMVFIHPILSLQAPERLASLPVTQFVTTDSIPLGHEKLKYFGDRIKVLSVGNLIGEVFNE